VKFARVESTDRKTNVSDETYKKCQW